MGSPNSPNFPKVEVLPDPALRWLAERAKDSLASGKWYPQTESQFDAINSDADILLFGGSAGSLKTSTALVSLIAERDFPRMISYFFRRTYPSLEEAQRQAHDLFPKTGARSVERIHGLTRTWQWPSGATFCFRQLDSQEDLDNNQGKAMSAIAFDESTHWEENFPRYILSRNRSTDPGLKIRSIFTTNPGNRGAKWHMKLWMNGVCPHCEPHKAPPQGVLHWNARWPSDDRPLQYDAGGNIAPVRLSVAYILGKIKDHNLLGVDYIARLFMQRPATAQALLDGCWKVSEGQFFDIFDYATMTIDRKDVGDEWWWPQWVGADYGFSVSSPAAGLLKHAPESVRCPQGVTYMVDEFGGQDTRDKTARGFARAIVERWVTDDNTGMTIPEKRWLPWYLSPDAWSEHGRAGGVSFNLANQINEILNQYGVSFTQARNDRMGGWMKCYSGLRDGEFKICRNCVKTIEAIESRQKDPDKEGDILKSVGDELDDFADGPLRYGYYSWATARDAKKPREAEMDEKLQQLWKIDATSAMLQRDKMQRELEQEKQPQVYSGNARQRLLQQQRKNRESY